MSWFSDLKIGAKLASGYAICILLCIVVGICGLISMAEMSHKADEILNKAFGGRARIADADHSLMKMRMLEGRLLLLKGEALQKLIAEEDKTQEKTVSLIKDYVNAAEDPEDKANCVELQDTFNAYLDTHNKLLTLIDGDPKVALDYYTGERLVKARANDKVVDKISQWNQKHGISLGKASQAAFNAAKIRIASVIALAFIISGLVAYLLSRKISKALALVCERMSLLQTGALERLNEGILALESGDLTHSIKADVDRIPVTSKDEFGVLAESFNSLIDLTDRNIVSFTKSQQKLSELMTKIKASSSQVNAASHSVNEVSEQLGASVAEIGVSMNDVASASEQSATCATELAAGSTHQAQSIQESANLMGQLSTAVNQVTLESKGTAEAAHSATVVAAGGMQDVTNSINGMHAIKITIDETAEVITELGNSSERITSIVQTIDDIARQTNLLALNAAIEAARAGEAGRGFAVVADEVRKLAERSRSATHEIGALVSQIQQQTDQAVSSMKARAEDFQVQVVQVERTGEAFQQIKDAFDEVLLRAQSISDATAEMSLLSGNVSQSISEVAAVVEQSSVAAEEVSATSEEVSASVYTVANATANQVRSVEELVASSVKLRDVAESLDTAISIFKTDLDEQETTVLKLNNKPQAA